MISDSIEQRLDAIQKKKANLANLSLKAMSRKELMEQKVSRVQCGNAGMAGRLIYRPTSLRSCLRKTIMAKWWRDGCRKKRALMHDTRLDDFGFCDEMMRKGWVVSGKW